MSIGDSKANKARLRPRRGRLRFPETGYKAAPRGYINLDEALDKLGRIRLPNEWDEFLRLREFPFQYEREKRLTFQYKLISKKGGYVISRTTVRATTLSRAQKLRHASRAYNKVRKELRAALEGGAVSAKLLTPNRLEPITSPVVWAYQLLSIFYTGRLVQCVEGNERPYRVLIDKSSLKAWLASCQKPEGVAADALEPRAGAPKIARLKQFAKVLPLIARRAEEAGYPLASDWLFGCMKEAAADLGRVLSKKEFVKQIWPRPELAIQKLKTGRPSDPAKEAQKNDRANMVALIKDGYQA
jgi:hypothetical protein